MKSFDEDDGYSIKKGKKKLNLNPNGPYNVKMTFRGIYFNITIENSKVDEFKITVKSSQKITPEFLEVLKRYLRTEGFENEAQQWNLFWEVNHYL